ncbi:hypothetical protein BSL78_23503 [Apostichopus japonicus]|uniref:Uncharacterized protein n=1 Tax=Stichopus japonicus TaxID=307972 RepID=A0A2G8JV78_STIJA|nr:hypothetical protein BSL78_23503 [Apostichopus japonicus]
MVKTYFRPIMSDYLHTIAHLFGEKYSQPERKGTTLRRGRCHGHRKAQSEPHPGRITEPAAGGSLTNQSRSRSGDRERQPIRPPVGIPIRDSRGRDTTHKPARRERTRSQSRSPRRGTRRGWSPASDQSSDSSDDGYRRAKRRYRPNKQRHEEEPPWLAQLTGLLKPLLEREQQRAGVETEVGSRRVATTTSAVPVQPPTQEPEAVVLGEDTLDCRASVNLSGLEDESDNPRSSSP